jgi:hypothetical protein
MKPLTHNQIQNGIAKSKLLFDRDITAILDEFESRQTEIYKLIFENLSDSILVFDQDMSNLFLDLCFDIIWLYKLYYKQNDKIKLKWLSQSC